jgi:hypothetical protein
VFCPFSEWVLVYPLAFWASVLHRRYGSAACLPQFHEICGKKRGLWNWEPPVFTNFFVDLFRKLAIHDGRAATAIFMVHFWSAIYELPNSLPHFRSLIALGCQTPHNFRLISAAVRFFALKNRVTARISQLARFSINPYPANVQNIVSS